MASPNPKPVFIFVHGAWHDSQTFSTLMSRLKVEHGYDSYAVDLPSSGLRGGDSEQQQQQQPVPTSHLEDAAAVRRKVEEVVAAQSGPTNIVLASHSYGGLPMSEAVAGLERRAGVRDHGVVALLFIASHMVPIGESIASVNVNYRKENNIPPAPAGTYVVVPGHPEYYELGPKYEKLYDDVSREEAQPWVDRLKPQVSAVMNTPMTSEGWRLAPSTMVVCTDDSIFLPGLQRELAARAAASTAFPVHVREIASSHTPFIRHQDELLRIAVEVAERDA